MVKETKESVSLTHEEMDSVYDALTDRIGAVRAMQEKAKKLALPETAKAAYVEANKLESLIVKFLTPQNHRAGTT